MEALVQVHVVGTVESSWLVNCCGWNVGLVSVAVLLLCCCRCCYCCRVAVVNGHFNGHVNLSVLLAVL